MTILWNAMRKAVHGDVCGPNFLKSSPSQDLGTCDQIEG